jgi:hypothetical protein
MSMICEVSAIPDTVALEVLSQPRRIRELLESLDHAGKALSLEKSWHGLHFTLTGTAWEGNPPLDFIAAGGETVGNEDVGYGPARVLRADKVHKLDAALSAISPDVFDRKFDVSALNEAEIYPQIWDEPREDLLEEYGGYFDELRKLVQKAAQNDQALIITIR